MPKPKESLDDRVKRLQKVYNDLQDQIIVKRSAYRDARQLWESRKSDLELLKLVEKHNGELIALVTKSQKAYSTMDRAMSYQEKLIDKDHASRIHYTGKTHADYFNKRY